MVSAVSPISGLRPIPDKIHVTNSAFQKVAGYATSYFAWLGRILRNQFYLPCNKKL